MTENNDFVLTELSSTEDFVAARDLIFVAALEDGQKAVSDQALIGAESGERKLFGVFDAAGNLNAVGIVGSGELDLVVRPSARGAGLGGHVFRALLSRAEGESLRVWVHGKNAAARHLLETSGFANTRTLLRMERPGNLADQLNTPTPPPSGFSFRAFDPADEAQLAAFIEVNAAAFASHPEQGALRVEGLKKVMDEEWFDAKDVVTLYDDAANRMAAFGWAKTTPLPEDTGLETELYVLGVHPDYAGQGLGGASLNAVFGLMAEHDPLRVTLYVEGDNESALALYKKTGFKVATRSGQWTRLNE